MASRNAHKESGNSELPRKPSNIESLTVQLGFTSDYKKCHARKPYSKSLLKDCGVDVPQDKRTRIGGILAQLSELEYSNPDADGLLLELSKLAICNGHHGSNFRHGGRLYKNPNQLILERLRAKWGPESQTSALGQEKSTAGGVHHGFAAATPGMATCGGTGDPFGGFEVSSSTPRDGTTASDNVQTATIFLDVQDDSGTLTPTLSTPTYQQSFGHGHQIVDGASHESPLDLPSPDESILSSEPSEIFDGLPGTRETTPWSEISEEDSYASNRDPPPSPVQQSRYAIWKSEQRRVNPKEEGQQPPSPDAKDIPFNENIFKQTGNASPRHDAIWGSKSLNESIQATSHNTRRLRRHQSFDASSINRPESPVDEISEPIDVEQDELRRSRRVKERQNRKLVVGGDPITKLSPQNSPQQANTLMIFGPWPEKNDRPSVHKLMDRMRKDLNAATHSAGYIYGFTDAYNPGFIKIGYVETKAESSDPSSVAAEVSRRRKDWMHECNYDMNCEFHIYMPSAVRTVEALIHISLHRFARTVAQCRTQMCIKEHREWFQLDVDDALGMTRLWSTFSNQRPYNDAGMLRKFWQAKSWDKRTERALKDVKLELWVHQYLTEAVLAEKRQEEELRRLEKERSWSEEKERHIRKKVDGKEASVKVMIQRSQTQ